MKKGNKMKNKKNQETFSIDYDKNSEIAKERIKLNTEILKAFKTASNEIPKHGIDIHEISSMQYMGLANSLLNYFGLTQNEYAKYGINNEYGYIFDLISLFRETTLTAEQFDEEIKWRQDLYAIENYIVSGKSSPNIKSWLRKQDYSGTQMHIFARMRQRKLLSFAKSVNLAEFAIKNKYHVIP
jgi:hypothetical protein